MLKLRAKVRKVTNSKKIFNLKIKEREQVSRNETRFNVGNTKKDLLYFQRVCEGALLFRNSPILDRNYPHLTQHVPCFSFSKARTRYLLAFKLSLEGMGSPESFFCIRGGGDFVMHPS